MELVRTASVEAQEAIRALGVKSEQVGGIIATITGIARQTNLLALTRRSSRPSGGAGPRLRRGGRRGTQLAEESQEAAQSIADPITAIQTDTQCTIALVEDGAEATTGGVETVEAAQAAFVRIGDAVGDVTSRTDEIIAAIERVSEAAEKVQADQRVRRGGRAGVGCDAAGECLNAGGERICRGGERLHSGGELVDGAGEHVGATGDRRRAPDLELCSTDQ